MPGMPMGGEPELTWHVLFTSWHGNLGWDLLAAAAMASYVAGLLIAHRRGTGGLPWYRVVAFVLAIGTLVVSVNTAVETYSHVLFWVHMVQHLLLIMVVPALLVLASPITLLVQVAQAQRQAQLRRLLTSGPVSLVTHPLTGVAIYTVVIVGTHLTSFMDRMMLHPWLHQAEHVLYLGGGYLFLLPLLGDEPLRWRPPYPVRLLMLFLAMAPETIVGIVLLQADHELFPAYAELHRMWGPSPLADLNRGGGIMWAFGDGLMMVFIVGVVLAYITHGTANATAGAWLEGVRRSTLASHLDATGAPAGIGASDLDSDLDSDDAALTAYNAMLARLSDGTGRRPSSPSGPRATSGPSASAAPTHDS